jgi:hypothetical protein
MLFPEKGNVGGHETFALAVGHGRRVGCLPSSAASAPESTHGSMNLSESPHTKGQTVRPSRPLASCERVISATAVSETLRN